MFKPNQTKLAQQTLIRKETLIHLIILKLKTCFITKVMRYKVKRQATIQEKIFATHIINIIRIQKKSNNPREK